MRVRNEVQFNSQTWPELLNANTSRQFAYLRILIDSNHNIYQHQLYNISPTMVGTKRTPMKRVLAETTNSQNNLKVETNSAKKRKLDVPAFRKPGTGPNGMPSSQPKSKFETEVLEKLSQDIDGLKKQNQEKDQQWARPPLDDFNSARDNLIFQQIECEEGSLQGGKTTVKLFGVTEV